MKRSAALLLLLLAAVAGGELILLTIAYCPTDFTGAGAIVKVNPTTGSFAVVTTFKWPEEIFGCTDDYDPAVAFDGSGSVLLDFFAGEGLLLVVDQVTGTVTHKIKPNDAFFTGFENFWYAGDESVLGIVGNVTETGYCDDGCFALGRLGYDSRYTSLSNIPFKEVADDVRFWDQVNNVVYVQAGYDLREERCAPADSDECLLALSTTTGELLSATYTANWTAYQYYDKKSSDGTVLAWIEGFETLCNHPYNNYLFGHVNLTSATVRPIACIPTNVTVVMDEWIGDFSADGSMFATGSGNAESGNPQLLVFDTATAAPLLDSSLPGLKEELKAAEGIFQIWGVNFLTEKDL